MQFTIRHNLMKSSRLRRVIALLFLLLTSVDLGVIDLLAPQACGDEHGISALLSNTANAPSQTVKLSPPAPNDASEEQLPEPTRAEGDCICCCGHILLAIPGPMTALSAKPEAAPFGLTALPSSPPQSFYHPPRLS